MPKALPSERKKFVVDVALSVDLAAAGDSFNGAYLAGRLSGADALAAEFGGGVLADMGCHFMDLAFWALDLGPPTKVKATGEAIPIKARDVVTFHASHKLKGVVQGDIPSGDEFE